MVRHAPVNTPIDGQRVVTGQIHNALTGLPVGSGSVSIGGTPRAVLVDSSGRFQLALTPHDTGELVLLIRYLGFERQADTVAVSRTGGANADVFLTYSNVCLDPVVSGTLAWPGHVSLDSLRRVP